MATILMQTTIPDVADDWNIDRFSLLADELRRAGHHVTARNRAATPDDPVLSALDTSAYDQLWLFAVDVADGLGPRDVSGVLRFRARGGGVLTARDHQDLGSSLLQLDSLGAVNHFHTLNPAADDRRDDQDNPNISWPNHHSGANGDYQPIFVLSPVHDLLRTALTPSGHLEWFPAHPHEGSVSAPPDQPFARAIAQGRSTVTGRRFNLAVVIEGETDAAGQLLGRAVACSTFHHFADMNWCPRVGAPSFVTDRPGTEIERDPERLTEFTQYVRNIAHWLSGTTAAMPT